MFTNNHALFFIVTDKLASSATSTLAPLTKTHSSTHTFPLMTPDTLHTTSRARTTLPLLSTVVVSTIRVAGKFDHY